MRAKTLHCHIFLCIFLDFPLQKDRSSGYVYRLKKVAKNSRGFLYQVNAKHKSLQKKINQNFQKLTRPTIKPCIKICQTYLTEITFKIQCLQKMSYYAIYIWCIFCPCLSCLVPGSSMSINMIGKDNTHLHNLYTFLDVTLILLI